MLPLSVIITFSALKEILENSKRASADREVNARHVSALAGIYFILLSSFITIRYLLGMGGFKKKMWKEIVVGDILRVLYTSLSLSHTLHIFIRHIYALIRFYIII